jgi:signal transduction histidine kinase
MSSLRLRLLLGALLGIGAALAIAGLFLVAIFDAHVHKRYVKELDDHVLQLAAAIEVDVAGGVALKHELSDPAFRRPLSGLYWQVSDAGRAVLRSRSLWDGTLALASPMAKPGELREGEVTGPVGQSLVLVERLVLLQPGGEQPLQLAVAGDRRVVDEARGEFARMVVLSLAVLGALLAAASGLQISAGLAPLRALHRQLTALRRGHASRIEGAYPREIAGLVEDLNGLLAAQVREVERARSNAGKLGHGLKTPLAVLTAEARTLRDKGDSASAESIEREVDTMNTHVGRALAATRAVGPRKAAGTSTPLGPLLQRLVGVMKRLPRGGELEWSVSAASEGCGLAIDHRDVEEMLGNLLDNARKWARSRVLVNMRTAGDAVLLTVDDDGPGVPEDRVEEVMAHGTRLDRTVPGTGIGLAIVQDLAALHGGSVALSVSTIGGVRIAVRLPSRQQQMGEGKCVRPPAR